MINDYKTIAESKNFIVLDQYTQDWQVKDSYQSEADLEHELIEDLQNQGYDNELNQRAWFDTVSRFSLRPAARDTGRYDRFAKFLESHGSLKNIPPANDYMLSL
ncbi:hypothetical protein [Endozoicomonas sp. ONNA1]|uniref:hypothetical protein n=1 Tax=Endozoicomonas sp. ONNA1 TaxID=2828740 RepID=UPI0021472334|nr:hypothetical protein [Endozoicomonas sp. ONNA1]